MFLFLLLFVAVAALRVEKSQEKNEMKRSRGRHCDSSGDPDVDIFMRSYVGDLKWLTYSAASITESIACMSGVVRNAVLVVPPQDARAFTDLLDQIWVARDLEAWLRKRWKILPSLLSIPDDGKQEQVLDKLHADKYTDARAVVFVDTDTVLAMDLTRQQLFDDEGKPYLCYRPVEDCGAPCENWMQKFVRPMLGEGDFLDYEFMCRLGQAYQTSLFPKLREHVAQVKGAKWTSFVANAFSGGSEVWSEPDPSGGFTEFNAMGAFLWQHLHHDVHWIRMDWVEMGFMACPVQTWSWEKSDAVIEKVQRQFECLLSNQHMEPTKSPFFCAQREQVCVDYAGL